MRNGTRQDEDMQGKDRELRRIRRKQRQPVRRHNTHAQETKLITRNPSKIKKQELKNREISIYDNNGTMGLIVRINGKNFNVDLTEVT